MTDRKFNRKLAKVKRQCEQHKQMKELLDSYDGFLPVVRAKKKKKVSNIMLCASVVAIIGYVAVDCLLQSRIGVGFDSTITPYWFAFWTGEIFMLAGIKTTKVIKSRTDNDADN